MIKTNIAIEQEKVIYSLDEISCYCIREGKYHIHILGWCFLKEGNRKSMELMIDNQKLLYTDKVIIRKDVQSIYQKWQVGEQNGFVLESSFDCENTDKQIQIGCVNEMDECEWFLAGTLEEFLQFQPVDNMEYQIEQAVINQNIITVAGWAFVKAKMTEGALTGDTVDFCVLDEQNQEIPCYVKRKLRSDVNQAFFPEQDTPELGFEVKWETKAESARQFRLMMKKEDLQETYEIDTVDLRKQKREQSRKYENFFDMLRRRDSDLLKDDWYWLRKKGWKEYSKMVKQRFVHDEVLYNEWRKRFTPGKEELQAQSGEEFSYAPCISIIVPAYKTPEKFLREMIQSVQAQSYRNWELCIGDGSVTDDTVRRIVEEYQKKDARIKIKCLTDNLGIAGNTNAAMELAAGDYIALLDHDDLLAPDALYEMVKRINDGGDVDVLYSDEDKVSFDLKNYFEPHFKSDLNIDLLRSNNYICHLFVVRRSIAQNAGGFRKEFDGSQDYDFILRCIEMSRHTEHIVKVLYHWRCHPNSTAANQASKMYCYEAGRRALQAHLERMGIEGCKVIMSEHLGFYHVQYPVRSEDMISIIIPNKDQKDILKRCIDSILEKTTYTNYEIIVVENNSTTEEIKLYYQEIKQHERIRVVYWKEAFNYSAINNWGAEQADGSYLLFLNNDIEVITPDWLEQMLSNAQRPEVGIVGAKLFYPDKTVQHAGVIIGMGGIAGHAFSRYPAEDTGYFARAIMQQNLNAVTAACMMVDKAAFDAAGGFEESLAVAFNDVDFCLKIRAKGYLIVYDPEVTLYHHESISRGAEDTVEKQERFSNEVAYMHEKWAEILDRGDEYYNPNLSLNSGRFELK